MLHPFYVKTKDGGEWVAASNLTKGDEVLTEDGRVVIEIQKMGQNGKYKSKWDFHIILDDFGNIIDRFALGVWEK